MLLALSALAAVAAPQESGKHWFYFDSVESAHGPLLVVDGVERRAVEDSLLIEYLADGVFGGHAQLAIDRADRNRVLIRFDLDGIDDFESAILRLEMHQSALRTVVPVDVAVHVVEETWSSAETTWISQPEYAAEPALVVPIGPEEGRVDVDVTALVRAWVRGDTENRGVALRAAEPLAPPPVVARPPAAGAIEQELIDMYPWAESIDAALEQAEREEKRVFVVVSGAFRPEPITEHERVLFATCLSHPAVREAVARDHVPVRVRVSPNDVAMVAEGHAVTSRPFGRSGLTFGSATPPALAVLRPGSDRVHVRANIAVFDHVEVLRLLGADASPRGETEGDGPEARYWRAAAAAARGARAASNEALEALVAEHPDSPWAFKARVRRMLPDLVIGYEALAAPMRGDHEASLVAGGVRFLLDTQLPDGSWPMGHPSYEPTREGISVLCAHALLLHGETDAVTRAHAWLVDRVASQAPESLNSFTATYWLDYVLERRAQGLATKDEVAGAISLLAGGQLKSGAWSYDRSWGERWVGGFGGWPKTTAGRAHGMNTGIAMDSLTRARALGFEVPGEVLTAGGDALMAMRVGPARFTYTWPEPRNFEGLVSSIGRAPAAETALWRLGLTPGEDLATSIRVFVENRATLRPPAKLSDSWLPPHGLSGYFHSFAYLHAARAIATFDAPEGEADLGRVRADVLDRVERDGTWMDTIGLGKPYATAMALLILDLTR